MAAIKKLSQIMPMQYIITQDYHGSRYTVYSFFTSNQNDMPPNLQVNLAQLKCDLYKKKTLRFSTAAAAAAAAAASCICGLAHTSG
jgi:hypothetical protein